MKDREFDFLKGVKCVRRSVSAYEYGIHDLNFEEFGHYANKVFIDRRGGGSGDVGDLIMASYKRRDGKFTKREEVVVEDFFWADYSHSCACAQDFLSEAESFRESEIKNSAYFSLVLYRRAEEGLRSTNFFSSFSRELADANYSECFRDIAIGRARAYFILEFPENHVKLMDFVMRKDRAVQLGDYELAAQLRDEINDITRLSSFDCPLLWMDE